MDFSSLDLQPLKRKLTESNLLFTFTIIAPLVIFWILFHLPSSPPGMTDPHSSYINMTNMYFYFVVLLLALSISRFKENNKTFIILAAILIAYPFLFIHSRYAGTLNPITRCFPYFKAILAAKQNSWFYILSHPWHTFESTHPHNGDVFRIPALLRTKLPGFAITAKLLSYFVFDKFTYMMCVSGLNIFSAILLVKALIPWTNERKWCVLFMLSATTFLIQPYGVEQICLIYLALSIFFMYKFKQGGNLYNLLASVIFCIFLLLDLFSAILIIPFVITYAITENKYMKKMLIYSPLYLILLLWLLSIYFSIVSDISLFKYYLHKYQEALPCSAQYTVKQDWIWCLKSSFLLMCIIYGSLFFMSILPLLFSPLSKTSILLLAGIIPAVFYTWSFIPSEASRQLHPNYAISLVIFFRYLSSLDAKYYDKIKKLCFKILVAYSVLHAIMIHKFYLIPEVALSPMGNVDTPPHPWGWGLGLMGFQRVTPMVFFITFVCWLLILIFRYKGHTIKKISR